MCDFRDGFKLCSCKEKEFTDEDFIWELRLRNSIKFLQGRAVTSNNLGNGLDNEWVVLNLNDRNCFDFEYLAKEGDILILSKGKYAKMPFIFQKGEWKISDDPFLKEISSFKNSGKIKEI